MDIHTITSCQWTENEETFSKILEDPTVRERIPLLNVNKSEYIGNSRLVRFCGMIQDMSSPEYYLEKFEVINKTTNESCWVNGKYKENITVKDDEYVNFGNSSNVTSERQTFVVITIPGVNTWVRSLEDKLKIEISKSISENTTNKRVYEETMDMDDNVGPSTSQPLQNKRKCYNPANVSENKPIPSQLNDIFPISTSENQVYHIKMYNQQDNLKINDVCEFIGFLDLNPSSDANCNSGEMDVDMTTSSLPKIHCIYFNKLKHNNPLLNDESDNKIIKKFNLIRKDLLIALTQLLFGDSLAAEYLLLHLISQVYLRREGLALGKLSLNFSNIPELSNLHYPSELYKFIENMVPKSLYLPMTLENLNDQTFVPKKNYDLNYLSSGLLQLSNNTHVVLDETKLTPGKLNEAGLNNVKALSAAIKHQTIAYDFKFYPLEFDCDIPFLILSEGKSMIYSDIHIVLQPDPLCVNTFKEILEAAGHFLKPELLNDIRRYLTLARMSEYIITKEVEEFIQNEFVKMRQNNSNASVDDLHSMLILARLISISETKVNLDEESWNKASQMEQQRKSRIRN